MYLRSSEQFVKVDSLISCIVFDIDLSVCQSVFLHFYVFICLPEWWINVYVFLPHDSSDRSSVWQQCQSRLQAFEGRQYIACHVLGHAMPWSMIGYYAKWRSACRLNSYYTRVCEHFTAPGIVCLLCSTRRRTHERIPVGLMAGSVSHEGAESHPQSAKYFTR